MTAKVWEETWDDDGRWIRVLGGEHGPSAWALGDYGDGDANEHRRKLAAAAPEMARLLLRLGFACPVCGYEAAGPEMLAQFHEPNCTLVAVLRKAGVIPLAAPAG